MVRNWRRRYVDTGKTKRGGINTLQLNLSRHRRGEKSEPSHAVLDARGRRTIRLRVSTMEL
jgi:hypothetical protein